MSGGQIVVSAISIAVLKPNKDLEQFFLPQSKSILVELNDVKWFINRLCCSLFIDDFPKSDFEERQKCKVAVQFKKWTESLFLTLKSKYN